MLMKAIKCLYGPTNTFYISSPVGCLTLVSCCHGIHSLTLPTEMTDSSFCPDPDAKVSIEDQLSQDNGYTCKPALECLSWLQNYFDADKKGRMRDVSLPTICMFGKDNSQYAKFTTQVWQTLAEKVQFGDTVTYGQLAGMCGNPRASRAVGQAMRTNPLVLVVPCHRVVLSGGAVGNYSGGRINSVKAWLLKHEGACGFKV